MICLPDLSQNGHLMQGKETKEVQCKWSLKQAKGECICCEKKKGYDIEHSGVVGSILTVIINNHF